MGLDINQLGSLLSEHLPSTVQEDMKANVYSQMIWTGMSGVFKASLKMAGKLSSILQQKGITEEEIRLKSESDENFSRLLGKILDTTGRELIESKLDAWAELIFKAYNGIKIDNGLDTDKLIRLLADLSPRELLILGEIYKNFSPHTQEGETIPATIPEHSPITIEDLEYVQNTIGMSKDEINSILIHLSSLALITPLYDRSGFYSNGKPIPAAFDYRRNNYGLCFFRATLKIRDDIREEKDKVDI